MHSTLFIIFLFIFVNNSYEHSIKKSNKWDYVVLAQQWPPAVCRNEVIKKCVIPANVTSWTVHGIWPTGKHSDPRFCNDSLGFNVSQIQSVESELLVVWPNLFPSTSTYSFWAHEWKKHGTCIISIPQLDNELKYFTMAIYLHNKYNFRMLLENGGILPDERKFYDVSSLLKTII
ncbi:ribonuclease Oy-like isoform X1 [Centruroides sculpturatus]|uniref:ribonuclease Oy-like isoform X1 n=1 Tax=Centruroides sculpturatus TaxID=218467 RepID=UPI000C6CE369|nr:ribonuclease Oy-like isoform X1 [Centruroides sculpturatus]